jgi:hypothetical protein
MQEQAKGRVVIAPDAKPMTTDLLLQCLLGMSLEGFVADAIAHPDKYDIWEDQ